MRTLNRLTDAMIDQLIDRDAYLARREGLQTERLRLIEQINKANETPDYVSDVRQFLELIKSLKNLIISAKPPERREIVEITTSNRTVDGKHVALEPSNWLKEAQSVLAAYGGDPHRPTYRTGPDLRNQQVTKLGEAQNLYVLASPTSVCTRTPAVLRNSVKRRR